MSAVPVETSSAQNNRAIARPRLVPNRQPQPQPARRTNPVAPIPLTAEHATPNRLSTQPRKPLQPDPRQIAGAVVQAALEVLRGRRPVGQLAGWLTPQLFHQLAAAAEKPVALEPTTLGPSASGPAAPGIRIRRVRAMRVAADAAEATVIVDDGDRIRAAAVRLELHREKWRVTVLQVA